MVYTLYIVVLLIFSILIVPVCSYMFRSWHNSATEMFVNLRIYSFDEMIRIFVFSFRSRLTASHNQLICSLGSAHCSVYSKRWAWWNSLLHNYTINVIIYLMHMFCANLYFIPFVYILFNCIAMNYVLYIVLKWT